MTKHCEQTDIKHSSTISTYLKAFTRRILTKKQAVPPSSQLNTPICGRVCGLKPFAFTVKTIIIQLP